MSYLSSWSGDGPSHDFLIGNTFRVRQSEDPMTAAAVKGIESVAEWYYFTYFVFLGQFCAHFLYGLRCVE